MEVFDGIGKAKKSRNANYIKGDLHGLFRIDLVKQDTNRKKDDFFAIEMTTLKLFEFEAETAPHRAGESVTHMIMFKHDMALPNIKAFMAGVLALDVDAMPEAELKEALSNIIGDNQPLSGVVVEISTRTIQTKKDLPFTVVDYRGEVRADKLLQLLSPEEQERFYPGNALETAAASA